MVKAAIVTGSNRGIGLGIVRALCKQFDGNVYLTSRNLQRGEQAVEQLKGEGLHAKYHQLDVCDIVSIEKLKQYFVDTYGGVDVLVNNAGVAFAGDNDTPFAIQAEVTMRTNYTALMDVCNAIFPILKTGARVVHLSSGCGTKLLEQVTPERFQQLKSATTEEEITNAMTEFVEAAKCGTHKNLGWVDDFAYGTSKAGVIAVTAVQQAIFDKDHSRPDIIVNTCTPGYVKTDMTHHKGHLTIEEGIDTPVYLALLPANVESPRGDFVKKRTVYKWKEGDFPTFGI